MELKFTYFFGPILVITAFLFFGKGIINRTRGKSFRPLPAFILLVVALAYRFLQSRESLVDAYFFIQEENSIFDMLLDRVTLALMDFGIGMTIDSAYLSYKKHNSKLFWVPGVLALVLSGAVYLFATFIETIGEKIRSTENRTELLLELGPDDHIEEVASILNKYHAVYDRTFPMVDLSEDEDLAQYFSVFVDRDYVEPLTKELSSDRENVDAVSVNQRLVLEKPHVSDNPVGEQRSFLANDPYMSRQWYADALAYNAVHQLLKDAKPARKAKVAIVDTGVDGKHEDLKTVFKKSRGNKDSHGHGTHCAGLAGAIANNGKGVGSLNWEGKFIDLSGYPALNGNGWGTDKTVAMAIIEAAEGGADVISMSLGGPGKAPKVQRDAIEYALKQKAIVVVAAGNSNRDAKDFSPASVDGVIVVSAVNQKLHKAPFSNTNTSLKMPIAAPGVDIMSSIPGSKYQQFSGTSMATPIVSGVIGIMRSFKPGMTTKEAYKMLVDTGKDIADSDRVGKLVQPKAIVEQLVPVPAM
ncbi:MAG: S8 family serine peptidase [Bacteroidota bacterium]